MPIDKAAFSIYNEKMRKADSPRLAFAIEVRALFWADFSLCPSLAQNLVLV